MILSAYVHVLEVMFNIVFFSSFKNYLQHKTSLLQIFLPRKDIINKLNNFSVLQFNSLFEKIFSHCEFKVQVGHFKFCDSTKTSNFKLKHQNFLT